MHTPNLEVGYLFRKALDITKQHFWLLLSVLGIMILIAAVPAMFGDGFLAGLLNIAYFVISGPLTAGVYFLVLRVVRGQPVELGQMFDGFQAFGKAFAVYILLVVICMIGFMLLLVPGIIAVVGLFPAIYLILDADHGAVDTLRTAWEMTRGYRLSIFVVYLALFGLALLGLLAFIVGVIAVAVFSMVVSALMYEELAAAHR